MQRCATLFLFLEWKCSLKNGGMHIQNATFHDSDHLLLSHFQAIHRPFDYVLHALMRNPAAAAAGLEYCWRLRSVVALVVWRLSWIFWAWVTIWGSKQVTDWHMIARPPDAWLMLDSCLASYHVSFFFLFVLPQSPRVQNICLNSVATCNLLLSGTF